MLTPKTSSRYSRHLRGLQRKNSYYDCSPAFNGAECRSDFGNAAGELVESGRHNELVKKNGEYARMWENYTKTTQWHIGNEVKVC